MREKGVRTLYLDEAEPRHNVPERNLLIAVIERACRDLLPCVDKHIRNEAINWFNPTETPEIKNPLKYTFNELVTELEFGAKELQDIKTKVDEAIKYEELRRKNPWEAHKLWEKLRRERRRMRIRLG